jgi:hypothetical protein
MNIAKGVAMPAAFGIAQVGGLLGSCLGLLLRTVVRGCMVFEKLPCETDY